VGISRTQIERVVDELVPGLSLLLRRVAGRELRSLEDVYRAGEVLWGPDGARFFVSMVAKKLDSVGSAGREYGEYEAGTVMSVMGFERGKN